MNYAYVTLLSTDSYYEGVVALFESLKLTKPKYSKFVVVVNEKISKDIIDKLEKRKYIVIKRNSIDVSKYCDNTDYKYWINTFDKLHIFELTEFDKILYLDGDLYIDKNIDELFNLPNMSAVISGKGYVKEWVEMNSGVMVIKPEKGLADKMLKLLKTTKFTKDIGDQDIINAYFDWKNKELAISERYNMYYFLIDYYVNTLGYDLNDFRVIHFIGEKKPWMMDEEEVENYIKSAKEENKMGELFYFDKYLDILKKIS